MIDSKLIILFVVCVIFMVYLSVEGFAAYSSYRQMLAAKHGTLKVTTGSNNEKIESIMTDDELTNKYKAMNLSGSELANAVKAAKEWQKYNAKPSNDFYKKLQDDKITVEDIRKTNRTGDDDKIKDKKWLTYYDATIYGENSPDIVRTASGSFLQKRTGSRWNETSYIDTVNFIEDIKKAGGRTLVQCKSDDFNCISNLTYSDPNYRPYQGDSSWQMQFRGGPGTGGTPSTNAAGFPSPPPPAGGSQAPIAKNIATIIECIKNCLNEYGGTTEKINACATLCA